MPPPPGRLHKKAERFKPVGKPITNNQIHWAQRTGKRRKWGRSTIYIGKRTHLPSASSVILTEEVEKQLNSLRNQVETKVLKPAEYAELYDQYITLLYKLAHDENDRKTIQSSIDKELFTPLREAFSSELYRWIGGVNFTPKVRILTHKTTNGKVIPVETLSKEITGFQAISSCNAKDSKIESTLKDIAEKNPREYARLFASVFVLAESDLNTGNWGIDAQNRIVKIDHDCSLFPISGITVDGFNPARHPNLIYCAEAFDIMSTWDIRNLPAIHDAKPLNFPLPRFNVFNAIFNSLEVNADFQFWKYFYFTKSLLLTETMLRAMINDHSLGNLEQNQKIVDFVTKRIEQLKMTLLNTPEYRAFVLKEINGEKFQEAFVAEVNAYNVTTGGNPVKPNNRHRMVDLAECLKSITNLHQDCQQKQNKIDNDPLSECQLHFNELITRFSRERKNIGKLATIMQKSITRDANTLLQNAAKNNIKDDVLLNMVNAALQKIPKKNQGYFFNLIKPAIAKNTKYTPIFLCNESDFEHRKLYWQNLRNSSETFVTQFFDEIKKNKAECVPTICNDIILIHNGKTPLDVFLTIAALEPEYTNAFDKFSKAQPKQPCAEFYLAAKTFAEKSQSNASASTNPAAFFSLEPKPWQSAIEKCLALMRGAEEQFTQAEIAQIQTLYASTESQTQQLKTALAVLFSPSTLKMISQENGTLSVKFKYSHDKQHFQNKNAASSDAAKVHAVTTVSPKVATPSCCCVS